MTAALDDTDPRSIGELAAAFRTAHLVRLIAGHLGAVTPADAPEVIDLLCGWLEGNGAGQPDPDFVFGQLRRDAAFWADIATPAELEAYVAAGLARIERRNFAAAAQKRLFVAFWECMSDADRRAFLARVDPTGKFRGAAA
ncbi:hypothetical protein [Roseicyclus sp.]|uniref:hypothetical protein n=1 Tax=Roseicyclus sp. TaxID=1914329 RepID=UPI003F6CEADB